MSKIDKTNELVLTPEELRELAKQGRNLPNSNKKEPIKIHPRYEYLNNVERFIEVVDIRPGRYKVLNWVLYDFYKKWATDPIQKDNFDRYVNAYFNEYKHKQEIFYKLNKRPWEIRIRAVEYPEYDINTLKGIK